MDMELILEHRSRRFVEILEEEVVALHNGLYHVYCAGEEVRWLEQQCECQVWCLYRGVTECEGRGW